MVSEAATAFLSGLIGYAIGKDGKLHPVSQEQVNRLLRDTKPEFIRKVDIDTSEARDGDEVSGKYDIAGSFILVLNPTTPTTPIYIKLNEPGWPEIPLTSLRRVTGPFYRFFIKNTAGAGTLNLIVAKGYQFQFFEGLVATGSYATNKVIGDTGNLYADIVDMETRSHTNRTVLVANITPGTEAIDQSQIDATEIRTWTGAYVLMSTFTLPIDPYLYVAVKQFDWEDYHPTTAVTVWVKWTIQKTGEAEEIIGEYSHTTAVNAWTARQVILATTYKKQTDVEVKIRCYVLGVTSPTGTATRNRKVTYDLLLPSLDYQVLSRVHYEGTDYSEVSASLATNASARHHYDSLLARLKVQAKSNLSDIKAAYEVDSITRF